MASLQDIFKEICPVPRPELEGRIFRVLWQQEAISIRRRLWLIRAEFSLSLSLFLGGIFFSGQRLVQSEFWAVGRLLFSDMSSIVGSLRDYSFLLLETLPVFPLVILFLAFLLFGFSMRLWASFVGRYPAGGYGIAFTH